jgi:hypothetical protein
MNSAESRSHAAPSPSPDPLAARKLATGNLLAVLLLLLALLGFATAWGTIRQKSVPVDFYEFWLVAQVMGRPDVANIYAEPEHQRMGEEFLARARSGGDAGLVTVAEFRRTIETFSSPFLYALFKAAVTGDFTTDLRNYRLLLLGCFAFSIIVFARLTGHSWGTTLGALTLFSVWYDPFYSDVAVGNVNGIQLAMLALYVWIVVRVRWRWRDVLGGACLGLAVAFKPNLVFVEGMLGLDWIIRRQGRRLGLHALGALLGVVLAVLIGAAGFKSLHCWVDWFAALRAIPGDIFQVAVGNFAPSRIVSERLGTNVSVPLVAIYGGLAVAGTWRRRNRRGENSAPPETDAFANALPVATGCLLMLLTAPLAWVHYFVLAVPMFLVLLSPVAVRRPTVRPALGQQILVLLAFLCFTVNVFAAMGLKFSNTTWGVLSAVGMTVLFLLAVFSRADAGISESR